MKNIEKLFDCNSQKQRTKKIKIKQPYYLYRISHKNIGDDTISDILKFCNLLNIQNKNKAIPLYFYLDEVNFLDKLTFIIFECILYYMISIKKWKIFLGMKGQFQIATEGIISSPLLILTDDNMDRYEKYIKKFTFEIYDRHYRKLLSREDMKNPYATSKLMTEISSFLKYFSISRETINQLSEVISELFDNVSAHSNGDCLIDIDVSKDYHRNDDDKNKFYGLNLVLLNYSDTLLGDGLQERLKIENLPPRYQILNKAHYNHSILFDNSYTEEDFYNIAVFQHHISGRERSKETGGTGLTRLIKALQEKSENALCYVLSGNKSLLFKQSYLSFNSDGWIGFNDSNDFINQKPNTELLGRCAIYFPGTAYNLNFIMKKESNDEQCI